MSTTIVQFACLQLFVIFRHTLTEYQGFMGIWRSEYAYDCRSRGARCLRKPDDNIKLGVYHLSKLVEDFESLPAALHAYHVGAVKAKACDPNGDEPKTAFTNRVLREYKRNCSRLPDWDEPDKAPEVE